MKIARLVVGFIAAVVLILAVCSYITKSRAEYFMAAIRELDVGSNDSAKVLAIAQSFGSSITAKSSVCNMDSCSVEFAFQNPLLKALKIESRSRLDAVLKVENHRVGYVYIVFGTGGGATPSSVVNVMEFADSVPGGFRLDIVPRSQGATPRIFVTFDNRASDSQKQSSLDLNLSCLNHPFKCRDAYDFAPSLPHRPEARSLLPNTM